SLYYSFTALTSVAMHPSSLHDALPISLGNIQLADAGFFFQRTNIENTFVRHATITTGIQHREGILQAAGNIVSVKNCHLACFFRSEEHTSELQSRLDLVCRLLLEKNKE